MESDSKIFFNNEKALITFGKYKGELLKWLVIDEKDDKKLLISEKGIDIIKYNERCGDITWEKCTLRNWLNNEFLSETFSTGEQERIESVTVTADKNPMHDTAPGNDTNDKIFLLSIVEADKYFAEDVDRVAEATEYALSLEYIRMTIQIWYGGVCVHLVILIVVWLLFIGVVLCMRAE